MLDYIYIRHKCENFFYNILYIILAPHCLYTHFSPAVLSQVSKNKKYKKIYFQNLFILGIYYKD